MSPFRSVADAVLSLRICIDVNDLDTGIRFYERALGLAVTRRLGSQWAELAGGSSPIDLLAKAPGSRPCPEHPAARNYARHWTPIHLDFAVSDIGSAVQRARAAGAMLEGDIKQHPWGKLANMADPFGHGFCLMEFTGRGYDEMAGLEHVEHRS